jgi:hypothetical protein
LIAAARLQSTLTCKLQAHYVIHEPPPTVPNPSPNHWFGWYPCLPECSHR